MSKELELLKEKMHSGKIYYPSGDELMTEQLAYVDKLYEYNSILPSKIKERQEMLKELLAEVGDDCYIEAPFYSNFGGHHVHFGNNVYANFGLTLVDDTHIYVGDYTMIGPNVTIATAGHPILPELRREAMQFNLPVTIGKNVWIGANSVILPGITIGDNSVIGAGSIVTKDVPENVVAVGNPCRVLREISDYDREYYHKGRKIEL